MILLNFTADSKVFELTGPQFGRSLVRGSTSNCSQKSPVFMRAVNFFTHSKPVQAL